LADNLYGLGVTAANTSSGNQTFTDSNFGGTPLLVVYTITSVTADGTITVHNRIAMGAADGTVEGCVAMTDEDGVGTTMSERWGASDKCITILDTDDAAVNGEAEHVSFSNNSATVNWTTPPDSAYLVTFEFYGGSDMQVALAIATLSASVNTSVTLTPGFEADVIRNIYGDNDMDRVSDTFGRINQGFFVNDGSETQKAVSFDSADNVGTSSTEGIMYSNRVCGSIGGDDEVEVENVTSTQYDLTTRDTGAGEKIISIAFNLGGGSAKIDTFLTPETKSLRTLTTTFEPGMFICLASQNVTIDNPNASGAATIGMFAMTENNHQSISNNSEDSVGTSITSSYQKTGRFKFMDPDSVTVKYEAAAVFTATGIELDFDDGDTGVVDATGRYCAYLAFEKGDGVAPTTPLKIENLHGNLKGELTGGFQ